MSNVTNSTSSTSTCSFPMTYKVIVSSLLAFTFISSPILNAVVCYTIISVRKLQSFGNLLIANLSLGDIVISLSLPMLEILYVSIYPKWLTGSIGTYVLNSIWLFSLAYPFVTVTVITAERFSTLRSLVPIKSTTISLVTVSLIWVYSLGSVAFMAFFFTKPGEESYEWNVLPKFYYPFLGIHIVIPLIVIAFLYIGIFRITRLSRQRTTSRGSASASLTKREMRVAKTIAIVIGIMFAIWIPALILEYFYAIGTESCIVQMAGPVSVWLSCSNGVVNPILYFYRNPHLRGEIVKKLPASCIQCFRLSHDDKSQSKRAAKAKKAEKSVAEGTRNTLSTAAENMSTANTVCRNCNSIMLENTQL